MNKGKYKNSSLCTSSSLLLIFFFAFSCMMRIFNVLFRHHICNHCYLYALVLFNKKATNNSKKKLTNRRLFFIVQTFVNSLTSLFEYSCFFILNSDNSLLLIHSCIFHSEALKVYKYLCAMLMILL
jgi:hypothetical protein